jgi:nitroreductase
MPTFAQMENNQFSVLEKVIKSRRSISWSKMNGKVIPDETVNQLLSLADYAPTHGRTEPWRFYVYGGEALQRFGREHAELYWQNTAEDKRQEATFEKLKQNVEKASHLVIAVMSRGANVKIPQVEEVAAASAAIQNVLLGAEALGIASFWSSGGMTHTQALKTYLHLQAEDIILGLIFLGYSNEPAKDSVRNTPLSEKIKWQ